MLKFIVIFASLASASAAASRKERVIGVPTGDLPGWKKRELEQKLILAAGGSGRRLQYYPQYNDYDYDNGYPSYGYPSNGYPYNGYMKGKKGKGPGAGAGPDNYYPYPQPPYVPPPTPYVSSPTYVPPNSYVPPVQPQNPYYPAYPADPKKKGKKGGKKGGASGVGPDDCHTANWIVKNPFNDLTYYYCDDDDCEMFITEEKFRMSSADYYIPSDFTLKNVTNSTIVFSPSLTVGSTAIWSNQAITDSRGNTLDARLYGSCEKLSPSAGAWQCTFTLIDGDKNQLTVVGVLPPAGGRLVITGGSGAFAGMIGDAVMIPTLLVSSTSGGDAVLDLLFIDVTLTIGYIVCPAQVLNI